MPWRAPCGACGPGLPRAVTLEENSPAVTPTIAGGRSTSTQWKKSTRGSERETLRPSWFTSSPRLGTSGSWQRIAKDFVPIGASLHARCGLRFFESVTCDFGSAAQNACSAGITPPSRKLVLWICTVALGGLEEDAVEVHLENERGVGRNRARRAALAIGLVRRNDEEPLSLLAHAEESLVPALDDAPGAHRESERRRAAGIRIELFPLEVALAAVVEPAGVADRHGASHSHAWPRAALEVLHHQLLGRLRAFGLGGSGGRGGSRLRFLRARAARGDGDDEGGDDQFFQFEAPWL